MAAERLRGLHGTVPIAVRAGFALRNGAEDKSQLKRGVARQRALDELGVGVVHGPGMVAGRNDG